MAKRNVTELLAGAVVLLGAAGFLGYAVANTGRTTISGYSLHARFDRIDGLTIGSDVRIAGVKVGSVLSAHVDPKTYQAVVTMSVQPDLHLPRDSSAEITSDGLLGGKYIALVPGGDEKMLPPGGDVTITQSSISLEELLGKFIFSASSIAGGGEKPEQPAAPAPATGAPAPKP
jgi:phospholipid/cholesterol/gamma-HCH transport system substrate-binding protein